MANITLGQFYNAIKEGAREGTLEALKELFEDGTAKVQLSGSSFEGYTQVITSQSIASANGFLDSANIDVSSLNYVRAWGKSDQTCKIGVLYILPDGSVGVGRDSSGNAIESFSHASPQILLDVRGIKTIRLRVSDTSGTTNTTVSTWWGGQFS